MKQAYVKGTDVRIVGTLDTVQMRTNVAGFGDDGTPVWGDDNKVFWDTSEQMTNAAGQPLYLDADGQEHPLDQLEFRDEEETA